MRTRKYVVLCIRAEPGIAGAPKGGDLGVSRSGNERRFATTATDCDDDDDDYYYHHASPYVPSITGAFSTVAEQTRNVTAYGPNMAKS